MPRFVEAEPRSRTVHADEHYILIEDDFDQRLIRARMVDAESRLQNDPEMRIYGSWWFAQSNVQKVMRIGRDYMLKTLDGQNIPIGCSCVGDLKKAGWPILTIESNSIEQK